MRDRLWANIIQIHQHAKELMLKAEEVDRTFSTFFAPVCEQRHAHEHVIRAQAAEMGVRIKDDEYVVDNLRKALGHEYRTFFDVADWLCVALRERIQATLAPYSTSCIKTVMPHYYSEIKPEVLRISGEIAGIRGSKDVSREEILDEVAGYKREVQELEEMYSRLIQVVPALEDYANKEGRESRRARLKKVGLGVVIGLLVALGVWLANEAWNSLAPSQDPVNAEQPASAP